MAGLGSQSAGKRKLRVAVEHALGNNWSQVPNETNRTERQRKNDDEDYIFHRVSFEYPNWWMAGVGCHRSEYSQACVDPALKERRSRGTMTRVTRDSRAVRRTKPTHYYLPPYDTISIWNSPRRKLTPGPGEKDISPFPGDWLR